MRSELEQLEKIDQYLSGKMSTDQAAAFEAQMNADPALKSMVNDQQLLIQTVSRKAMLAEINAVAGVAAGAAAGGGAAASGWGLTQWVIAAVSAVGATVGGVAIYNSVSDDEDPIAEETVMLDEDGSPLSSEETYDTTADYFALNLPVDEEEALSEEDEENGNEEELNNDVNAEDNVDAENDQDVQPDNGQDQLNEFSNLDHDDSNEEEIEANPEFSNNTISIVKNRKASFLGGHAALQRWFEKNLKYPGTAKKERVQGTIKVTFHVKETGEVDIIDSECITLLDENGQLIDGLRRTRYRKSIKYFRGNAERAFRICPNWIPATNTNGTAVLSEQVWYVKFNLHGKSEVYSFGDDDGGSYEEIDEGNNGMHNYTDDGIFFEVNTSGQDATEEQANK